MLRGGRPLLVDIAIQVVDSSAVEQLSQIIQDCYLGGNFCSGTGYQLLVCVDNEGKL